MKKSHSIFLFTLLFIGVFYQQDRVGINLAIFGCVLAIAAYFNSPENNRNRSLLCYFVASILSCIAFAWYGDFSSFVALIISLILLQLKGQHAHLSVFFAPLLAVINGVTFVFRFFNFNDWLTNNKHTHLMQKTMAYVIIPLVLFVAFFGIYSIANENFAHVWQLYEFQFEAWELFIISILGFFLCFNYWNFEVLEFIEKWNTHFNNHYTNRDIEKENTGFFTHKQLLQSATISLFALSILLIIFLGFNLDDILKNTSKAASKLASATHESVNAVIVSIFMSIAVILFFFRKKISLDPNTKSLKKLAKIWLILNLILLIFAAIQNTSYISELGLTYKRLGVFTFLLLCCFGLAFAWIKIEHQKTNLYLFRQMSVATYAVLLLSSFINWGSWITDYNLKNTHFDWQYHQYQIDFNKKNLLEAAKKTNNTKLIKELKNQIKENKQKKILSKVMYYEGFPDE